MKNKIAIILIVILSLYIFVYFIIYPLILAFFAPFPEIKDVQTLNDLRLFSVCLEIAKEDEPDKSPKGIFDSMDPKIKENIILIIDSAWVPKSADMMIAYSKKILPKANSPASYGLPFYAIRGWPDKTIPERRGALFSDGSTKILIEKEFQETIKSNHFGSGNLAPLDARP